MYLVCVRALLSMYSYGFLMASNACRHFVRLCLSLMASKRVAFSLECQKHK